MHRSRRQREGKKIVRHVEHHSASPENAKVCFASGSVGLNVGYPKHELLGLKGRRKFPPQFELTVRLMQINERPLDPTSQWVARQKGELPWASSAKTSRRWTIFSCTACRIFIMLKIRSLKPCPR